MNSIRADFPNGDYVLLDFERALYFRKRLGTVRNYVYTITTVNRQTQIERGPVHTNIVRAINKVIRDKMVDARTALQLFYPSLLEFSTEKPSSDFSIAETSESPMGQPLAKFLALNDVVFQHPLHMADEERTFTVKKGSISGWMPIECINNSVWVDDTSYLSGAARNALITNRSIVADSRIAISWIRKSNVTDSVVVASVIQKSNVEDCDLVDCGIRGSSITEVHGKKSSVNNATCGVADLDCSGIREGTWNNSLFVESNSHLSSGTSAHLLNSSVEGSNVISSFIQNTKLDNSEVIQSNLVNTEPTTYTFATVLHNRERPSSLQPSDIKVTV